MLKPVLFVLFLLAFVVAARQLLSASAGRADVPSTIIAIERNALNQSDKGDPAGFLAISDPEVTYFDPFVERPIHGLDALRTYYGKFTVPEGASGEMSNAKVQVSGEVAVLTFNYTSKVPSSPRVTRWNTTEVYRHTPKGWRIIHTNWSYLQPKLAQPD